MQSAVSCLSFSADAESMYVGSEGGTAYMWDLKTSKEIGKLRGHLANCQVVYGDDSNGNMVITGSKDTNVKVWDIRSKTAVNTFKEHQGPISCVRLSPDSKWAASGSEDGCLKIWNLSTNEVYANFYHPDQTVTCCEFNP